MITRAQIRRQLRQNGGIMNAVPRQGYFLGKIVRGVKKAVGKVGDIAGQVIKSPIGKAALIGLGGAGLMGMGPLSGLGGIGAKIGGGLSGFLGKAGMMRPGQGFGGGSGLMGLLSKGKNVLGGMSGIEPRRRNLIDESYSNLLD